MSHISFEQRCQIEVLIELGPSGIGDRLGKSKSVISREIKRNADKPSGKYIAVIAQDKCQSRHKEKYKHIKYNAEMKQYVKTQLELDYSPEQICGRAKLEGKECVSHESIYQDIWKNKKEGGDLCKHLRRQGRKYRKRGALKDTRGLIKNRVDIDQRPAIVDEKKRPGDLEIDTVIGQNHKGAILTINDRVTGQVWIRLLTGKEAEATAQMTIDALSSIKDSLHTITSDNGKEFACHEKISKELGIEFYFAKPYHSWERGANENTNGLIRQYFKKGTSFENLTAQDMERVENILNNRPRKKLGYLSPNEYHLANFANKKVGA